MDQTFSLTWGLSFDDLTFINGYNTRSRLGVALQLKHLQHFGYFADEDIQVGEEVLNYLSDQLGGNRPVTFDYNFQSRSARRHMMEIVQYLGFERMSDKHRTQLAHWLRCEHCGHVNAVEELISIAYLWCLEKKVFAPSRKIVERVVRSARREFQKEFLQKIVSQFSQEAIVKMETSLVEPDASTGFSCGRVINYHTDEYSKQQKTADTNYLSKNRVAYWPQCRLSRQLFF
ncbi:DUF4158 domain-containing protein [Pseudovibrio sp. Ad14]|uniref:DUF4158 domain-containing protein n=2 Tax=unclassified Pseudovibrio TaxID=2627060 RepID=UPI0007AEA45E|nr:DUF4158 domain-containing protein [Pseudovibrio sp. Ad14]KZL10354.1 hypothetical protein PsAD14_01261 [Pseudovibrio sp. Ad14]